jgi:glyoxylase-like metal-dependent hydrolase (beta-lactamase superfamily II)
VPAWICETCGVQHAETSEPPAECAICEDERQYRGPDGQRWTTLEALRAERRADVRELEPQLVGLGCEPEFAIGQRALLVATDGGNVLWDCVPILDGLVERVQSAGGISAIAVSHPHFHSTMIEWSRAFDAPVYLHTTDREWVMRPDDAVVFWEGEAREVAPGVTVVHCGGHFPGATALHWSAGADGRGALFAGDTVMIAPDRGWLSFMYSFPNLIPLDAAAVQRIADRLEPYAFDRIYGGWWDRLLDTGAKDAVRRSAERYIRAITGK